MSILFAASEVGSVRAVLPIAEECSQRGYRVVLLNRGAMPREFLKAWGHLAKCDETEEAIHAFLTEHKVSCLVFSSNVKDELPLRIARIARDEGIPTVHVLDYWNGYASRMMLDGSELFLPDVFAVPDQLAAVSAIEEGIDSTRVVVTGQPGFLNIKSECLQGDLAVRKDLRKGYGFSADIPLMIFVSEPVEHDQGNDCRGYTEQTVLQVLCEFLQKREAAIQLAVLPHPREDAERLKVFLEKVCGGLVTKVLRLPHGRDALQVASGVIGMSSTLLYESWLLGLPTMSLQPNLNLDSLRTMEKREGCTFVDDLDVAEDQMEEWMSATVNFPVSPVRAEAEMHAFSTVKLAGLIDTLNTRPRM